LKPITEQILITTQDVQHYSIHSGILRYTGRICLGSHNDLRVRILSSLHSSAIGGHSTFMISESEYYGPFYDQPRRQRSPKGGHNEGGVKAFSHDLKWVCWPLNFKSSRIEKYDGSTNPAEWFEVFQLAIEAAGGVSHVMINYLPVCLSSSARMWLL
jgi:hypothetical protein